MFILWLYMYVGLFRFSYLLCGYIVIGAAEDTNIFNYRYIFINN